MQPQKTASAVKHARKTRQRTKRQLVPAFFTPKSHIWQQSYASLAFYVAVFEKQVATTQPF